MISHAPAEFIGPGFVVVQGAVEQDTRVGVLIDTGDFAPYQLLITPRLAGRLHAKPTGPPKCLPASLGPGNLCFTPVSLHFCLGSLGSFRVHAAISPEAGHIAERLGSRFDAVIGGEFLKSHRLTIDYRRHLATFDGPLPKASATTFESLPAPAVIAVANVNGAGPFRFLIDTAAADTIATPDVANRAHVAAGWQTRIYGAGGSVAAIVSPSNRVCVSLYCRSKVTVDVAELPTPIPNLGTSIDGVLGLQFLAGRQLTIDYPTRRFWLVP